MTKQANRSESSKGPAREGRFDSYSALDLNIKTMKDLFGNDILVTPRRVSRREVFNDYEGFVEKFKPKKTTDDCYTPDSVYDAILGWVRENADIEGREIVRPFYPGGDYEHYDYPDGCVVIDNSPFSIISRIARFYTAIIYASSCSLRI